MKDSKGRVEVDKSYCLTLRKDGIEHYHLHLTQSSFCGLTIFLLGGFSYLTGANTPPDTTFRLTLKEPVHLFAGKDEIYDYPDVACSGVYVKRIINYDGTKEENKITVDKVKFVFAKDFIIEIGIDEILDIISRAEYSLLLGFISMRFNNDELPYLDNEILSNERTMIKTDINQTVGIIPVDFTSKNVTYLVYVSSTLLIGVYQKEYGEFVIPVNDGMYLTPLLTRATFQQDVPKLYADDARKAIQEYLNGLEQ